MARSIPAVEVSLDGDSLCIGRPDGKIRSRHSVDYTRMRAHFFVKAYMAAFIEEVKILVRKLRHSLFFSPAFDGA